MAGANTLRPISMPKPGSVQQRVRRGGFGVLGGAAWVCLLTMGSAQPVLHADSPAPAPRCQLRQKTPLFVGFAQDQGLDSFEASAMASRGIIRAVKHWACSDSANASLAVPSLQLAFARSASLQLDRLQFDDADLARAHVVISDTSRVHRRMHWRLDVAQADESGWVVTETRVASARDSAEPKR